MNTSVFNTFSRCSKNVTRVCILGLCALTVSVSVPAFSNTENHQYQLHLQGSNTVGSRLGLKCAASFLTSQNFNNVQKLKTAIPNEWLVRGEKGIGFNKQYATIKIDAHGSSTGFKGLLSGDADIAMSSRPIKTIEYENLKHLGDMRSPMHEHTLAIDGLAILVNPMNPIDQLSTTQIAQLFSGEIQNWKELGGYDKPVSLYARDNNSGTWDTFKNLVLGQRYRLSNEAFRFESNDTLSDLVSQDMGAIGFSGIASIRKAKAIAVSEGNTEALLPNVNTVSTEDYPLSRRLFLYAPQGNAVAQAFIQYCLSESGQNIVEETGFISQNIQSFDYPIDAAAPIEYQQLSKQARRLSVNFRFSAGSPQLDNKAYRDIDRLVQFINQPENTHYYLYLVGFSDAGKQFNRDLLLSRFRALAVRGQLADQGVSVAATLGLGSFMPVASYDNSNKLEKNGRVEVWVSPKRLTFN